VNATSHDAAARQSGRKAVLFDLGNTLVSYYAAAEFAPILRACLRGCRAGLERASALDEDELFQRALTLNVERADQAVWPLAERLQILFAWATIRVGM
jgi:FMN phosphatase YigB (HAD superfamily)